MLRGAIVGLGNIATRGHIPAYGAPGLRNKIKIVAACDNGPEGDRICRDALPGAKFFMGIEEMLDDIGPDFVDVCAPPGVHALAIEAAADRGMHILCEKPLVESPGSVGRVRSALAGKSLVFAPCHQYRYSPLWSEIGAAIRSGEIGDATLAEVSVHRTGADTGRPGWNPLWRTDKAQSGGGILVDTGSHYFYLVQDYFGKPSAVTAILQTLRHTGYGVEDTAMVTLHYEALVVQINLTWAAYARMNRVWIAGTRGTLTYDGSRLLVAGERDREIPMPDVSDKQEYVRWYEALIGEFAGRIERKNYSADRLEEAITVMNLLETSYNSGVEGKTLPFA